MPYDLLTVGLDTHLWGLDYSAIHADERIEREYRRLKRRPLTAA